MFIPDPEFSPSRIPDLGSKRFRIRILILTQKIVSKISEITIRDVHPGSRFLIHLGSKGPRRPRIPDPGSGSDTLFATRFSFFMNKHLTGGFISFFYVRTFFNTASSAAVIVDAGIESRTIETLAWAVRSSNHST